jgi:glycosyltransferase involved in cell wall biosynthesis
MGKQSQPVASRNGSSLNVKIVFFTHGGVLYGANLSMIDLIVGLRKKGVASMVIHANDGPIKDRLCDLVIPSRQIPFDMCVHWRSDKPLWHPRRWASELANAVRAVRKERFNRHQLGAMVAAAREFRADIAVSNASSTVIGLEVAKILGIPHVWHIREFGDLDWDYFPDGGFRRRREHILQSAKAICVSAAVARHHKAQCAIADDGRFAVVHNPVGASEELAHRAALYQQDRDHGPFIFCITGFVKYSKGQFDAVSALRRVIDKGGVAHLVVAGQGAIKELKAHAQKEGVAEHVHVLGHVADLANVYQRADCGLMCSIAEGFGRVTAEFMSWGKPVIGRNCGATSEVIEDGVTGLLYDGTIDGLSSAMIRIMRDQDLRRGLARRALQHASSHFSQETSASAFLSQVSPHLGHN